MRAFKYFYLTVDFITGNKLQWGLSAGFKDVEPYQFQVQVSQTLDFSSYVYTIDAGNNYFAVDDSNIKQNWSKDLYYRVRLTTGGQNGSSESVYYSEPLAYASAPTTKRKYRMAAEMMRRFAVAGKFGGFQGYLLKRKIYGQVDTENVDPITGIPLNNNLGSFGTGIVGGYYPPLAVMFVTTDHTNDKTLSPDGIGVKEANDKSVCVQGFPFIESYDVIVNAETNQRYYVNGFKYIYFPGTEILVQQKLDLKLLPITDKLYKIEVPPYRVPQIPLQDQPGA